MVVLYFLMPVLLIAGVVLLIVFLATRRSAPDPRGRRPMAIYLLSVMFVTLVVALIGMASAVNALVSNLLDAPGAVSGSSCTSGAVSVPHPRPRVRGGQPPPPPPPPPTTFCETTFEETPRLPSALRGGIIAVVAGAVFAFHAVALRGELAQERRGA